MRSASIDRPTSNRKTRRSTSRFQISENRPKISTFSFRCEKLFLREKNRFVFRFVALKRRKTRNDKRSFFLRQFISRPNFKWKRIFQHRGIRTFFSSSFFSISIFKQNYFYFSAFALFTRTMKSEEIKKHEFSS